MEITVLHWTEIIYTCSKHEHSALFTIYTCRQTPTTRVNSSVRIFFIELLYIQVGLTCIFLHL